MTTFFLKTLCIVGCFKAYFHPIILLKRLLETGQTLRDGNKLRNKAAKLNSISYMRTCYQSCNRNKGLNGLTSIVQSRDNRTYNVKFVTRRDLENIF